MPQGTTVWSAKVVIRGSVLWRMWDTEIYFKVFEAAGIQIEMNGETGRCARVRCGEHYKDYQEGDDGSNLFDHVKKEHEGDRNTEFGFEVVRKFQSDVLARQLEEGMQIENILKFTG